MKKLIALAFFFTALQTSGQKNNSTYPSLLWEITGNGLSKPSFLFGTMHVSNKMVFHLSDSFYNAIASCDVVSLELDPRQWQSEMFRIQKAQSAMLGYSRGAGDYISEKSFQANSDFSNNMRVALSEEPFVINSLLYRTAEGQSNFQENTYLDLYVYQTARRLGKKATGVENYLESEKIQLEAQEDMFRDRMKPRSTGSTENPYELQRKIQDAYRRGDLSLMDSLSQLSGGSEAYNEKFLYGRNEIQANSIDSIIKKESLFVAVGAAHLPGKRGVIEMLRNKGYTLRPVSMTDRDAAQRDHIDKIRVPVQMQRTTSDDGFIEVNVPGKMFRRTESSSFNESWQYADMENGAYYTLSRIKLHSGQNGETVADANRKTDSLLYENVPGKIIGKNNITINGYHGLDIINKTRRGDIQRYNIIYTPQEVLVFKMSGNDEYVNGKEAEDFFKSIKLKELPTASWQTYSPASGGFSVRFPQFPVVNTGISDDDRIDTYQYESVDPETGDGYMVMRKSVNNTAFMEEDTFDISLMEESLKSSEFIDKQLSRKFGKQDGNTCLDMVYSLKDGGVLKARAFIKGAQYWMLTARSSNAKNTFGKFFSSFRVTPFVYGPSSVYTDMAVGFMVSTPVTPDIDNDLKEYLNKRSYGGMALVFAEVYMPTPIVKNAYFKSSQTGEAVQVTASTFPKYYYQKDTAALWDNEINWKSLAHNFIIGQKKFERRADSSLVCTYILADTNTNRHIRNMVVLKNSTLYRITSIIDEPGKESSFIKDFYNTFQPSKIDSPDTRSLFTSKGSLVLHDLEAGDSTTQKIARSAMLSVTWKGDDLAALQKSFAGLHPGSKDYLVTKTNLIKAAGCKDTVNSFERVNWLQSIYKNYSDTGMFQNAALMALANIKTEYSYDVLQKLLVQNPAIFENNYEYQLLFRILGDSLALSKTMFPGFLQLTAFDDYKQPVLGLLARLADSNYIQPAQYAQQVSKILFDAQVQLRKIQAAGERETARSQADDNALAMYNINNASAQSNSLPNYLSILAPLYNENTQVQKLFAKIFGGNDVQAKMTAALALVRNNISVPDTMLTYIASNDQFRSALYERLDKINKQELFPAKYKTQQDMSRSVFAGIRNYARIAEIQPMGSQFVQAKKGTGYVYFYKYRMLKQGDWLIGITGIQPEDTTKVNTDKSVALMMNKKLVANGTEKEQYEKELKRVLLAQHRSAAAFYRQSTGMFNDLVF